MSDEKKLLPFHPVADLFPLLRDTDPKGWAEFVDSIKRNGQVDRITLMPDETTILDGRNRYLACIELGIEPKFQSFDRCAGSHLTPEQFAFNTNIHRRNLTDDQKVAITAKYHAHTERDEAKKRMLAGKADPPMKSSEGTVVAVQSRFKPGQQIPNYSEIPDTRSDRAKRGDGDVRTKIARTAKVSQHKAGQALNVQAKAPELLEKVIQGKVKLNEASKTIAPKPRTIQAAPVTPEPDQSRDDLTRASPGVIKAMKAIRELKKAGFEELIGHLYSYSKLMSWSMSPAPMLLKNDIAAMMGAAPKKKTPEERLLDDVFKAASKPH